MNSQSRKKSIFAFPTAIPLRDKCKGIVAGYNHSYAYTQKKVYFWGEKHRNLHNQQQQSTHSAGSKESGEENDKMIVLELAVDRIATGKSHNFGWNDSNVYCWGSNEYYELGLQEEKEYSVTKMDILQKAIQRGYNLKEISCGEHHTLAYFHNKTKEYIDPPQKIKNALVYEEEQVDDENPNAEWQLFGWGQSNSYQLTINTLDIIPYPVISPCTFKSLSRIYSKSDYNIAICQGKVYSWGCNLFSRLGQLIYSSQLPKVRIPREVVLPEKIVKIGIGTYHVVAVSESGTAFSWGKGNQGQLGVDKLEIEGRPSKMICEYKIKDVSCGQSHTLVLVQNGRLMSCGSSNHGVLGHDSFDQNDKKKKVKKLEFVVKTEEIGQIVSISCGSNHNLVLTSKGEVFGWGSNEFFQIMPTLNENHGESRQKIKDVQKKDSYYSHAAKDSLQDRLSDWKRRYEAFKQAKLKQQQLFMAELSQIIGQGGRGRQTMN